MSAKAAVLSANWEDLRPSSFGAGGRRLLLGHSSETLLLTGCWPKVPSSHCHIELSGAAHGSADFIRVVAPKEGAEVESLSSFFFQFFFLLWQNTCSVKFITLTVFTCKLSGINDTHVVA